MGVLVIEALKKAITGLCDHNMALLKKVKAADSAINSLEFEIDDRCAIIIATEQPVAQDLRHLISILKIVYPTGTQWAIMPHPLPREGLHWARK